MVAPCGMNCNVCAAYLAYTHDVKGKCLRMMYCIGCRPRNKPCAFLKKSCDRLQQRLYELEILGGHLFISPIAILEAGDKGSSRPAVWKPSDWKTARCLVSNPAQGTGEYIKEIETIQVERMLTMKDGLVEVNGARIYYEVRGSGPPLLLIMGLTGDAGWFEPLAELLAEQFTVITYDRRGNSRSPRPEGWTSTSVAEQADDAAGLLSALHLSPAIVFGNSFGAMILLELIARHPQAVRGAIVHEPPLLSLLYHAQGLVDFWKAKVAKGGPRYALRVFTGMKEDEAIHGLDPNLMQRAFDNGEVIFSVEMPVVISYKPNAEVLRESKIPIFVAAGEETAMYLFCASRWLATELRTDLHMFPGGHVGYADQPREFATALLPLLEKLR